MMRIAYFDEAGDDGFPKYSSELFVLSAMYMPYLQWRSNFLALHELRRTFRKAYGLPVKTEFHTRPFLLNKSLYRDLGLSDSVRLAIVEDYCRAVSELDVRIISVCIVKPRIEKSAYEVLDWALKLCIQRIENDMRLSGGPDARFMVITDPGRVGKMRKTTRKVQRFNYIRSMFGPYSYRRELERLLEDPLPKDSRESYFIQTADLVSYIVYLYAVFETGHGTIHGRMPSGVTATRVRTWLDLLKPALNLAATRKDEYGVYFHPARKKGGSA